MNALTLRGGLALPAALSVRRGLSPKPSGGGPAPYHADAVHFDGSTWFDTDSLVAPGENTKVSFSLWSNVSALAPAASYWVAWVVDPEVQYLNYFALTNDGIQQVGFNLSGPGGANIQNSYYKTEAFNVWNHWLGSADTAGNITKLYLNDVDVTDLEVFGASGWTVLFNLLPLYIGSDTFGSNWVGDGADIWIAPGQSLLDGGGAIPVATRRKFISAAGKPVYLGATGELPTGTVPVAFFSGDATTFATNLGTGGAFTTTGILTNASSSPSD